MFIRFFLYIFLCFIFCTDLVFSATKDRISVKQDKISIGVREFSSSYTVVECPDYKAIESLFMRLVRESFPANVKNIYQTESFYTADEREDDLKKMLDALRSVYEALDVLKGLKKGNLIVKGRVISVLISNFIGAVERFNLLLRNRWYVGTEQLKRKSITHTMMQSLLQQSENKELLATWFQLSEYIFSTLSVYKKIELDKQVELKYFPIAKSTDSAENTTFSLGYIKVDEGYWPFVTNADESFEAHSLPIIRDDGLSSYSVHAENGKLIEDAMLVFTEDVVQNQAGVTVEFVHGTKSKTPLVKEYVSFIPDHSSLVGSGLRWLSRNNLGALSGYLFVPQTKHQRNAFYLAYLESVQELLKQAQGDELNQLSSFIMSHDSTQLALEGGAFFDALTYEDLLVVDEEFPSGSIASVDVVDVKGKSRANDSDSALVSSASLKIKQAMEKVAFQLEKDVCAEIQEDEEALKHQCKDFLKQKKDKKSKGKKGKGKGKQERRKKESIVTAGSLQKQSALLKAKASQIIENYKVEGRVKMKEWHDIFNHLVKDIDGVQKESGISEGSDVVNLVGSHSVLHTDEGRITLVRPHGKGKDNAFSSAAINGFIEEYVSVKLLKHIGSSLSVCK